ncbi:MULTISPECIES: AraC family transcriptional regulator [unclassified Modestobacter]
MRRLIARDAAGWSRACSEAFVPLRAETGNGFRGRIDHVALGAVGISSVACTANQVTRAVRSADRRPTHDDVLVNLHLAGSGRTEHASGGAPLLPGTATLYDADSDYRLRFDTAARVLTLQVPRERLGMSSRSLRALHGELVDDRPTLTVLRHLLVGVIAAGGLDDEHEEDVAHAAVDLLSAVFRADPAGASPSSGEVLYLTARSRLAERAADPSTTIDSVAREQGISRRRLEVVFAAHGESPAAFLRSIRLATAGRLLRSSPHVTVAEAAHAAGFSDIGTFTRAFRRQTGLSPTSWRREQG